MSALADAQVALRQSPAKPDPQTAGGSPIVNHWVDFICLGGGSLVLLPLLMMMPAASVPALVLTMWMLADVLNHPHFAASYQIFYRGFRQKLLGTQLKPAMRIRYLVAGVVVPIALLGFFAVSFLAQDRHMLGYAGNVMLFLVGWHYTKQGYGMLMVDAVYSRRFFNERDKAVFLYNAYACWILFWLGANWYVSERHLWGLNSYSVPVPEGLLWVAGLAVAVTTALTLRAFAMRLIAGAGLPWMGVVAYLTSLYFWMFARLNPIALMFIPAFHSLQYLLIVWRAEKNRAELAEDDGPEASGKRLLSPVATFMLTAFLLGLAGFWWLPGLFDRMVPYDAEVFGGTMFMFMFWIFINIHHYFMDNVIWRRDNPDTARALFGAKAKPS
ncbi:MAG: hypothetical protein AAF637_00975 [Pseudomonadota bacterium]